MSLFDVAARKASYAVPVFGTDLAAIKGLSPCHGSVRTGANCSKKEKRRKESVLSCIHVRRRACLNIVDLGRSQRGADSRIVGLLKSVLTRQCPAMCLRFRPGGLTHHLPGAGRPRFACIESLERPERPTQTCGKHEGSLIVSTLRAFCFFGRYDSGA